MPGQRSRGEPLPYRVRYRRKNDQYVQGGRRHLPLNLLVVVSVGLAWTYSS
jgi:hypothetical protein